MQVSVIGGGTGLSVILKGLRKVDSFDLHAIVTVADDGGSTGRLRDQYRLPAMGDIRNVMVAMGEDGIFKDLMNYRFSGEEDVGGHNLGNLILTALSEITGNFNEAIANICDVLNINGEIIPSTNEYVSLYAKMDDGVIVKGEHNIPEYQHYVDYVFYDHDVAANDKAVDAILNSDVIILGLGSLYTSIMPNLIIEDIKRAIQSSKAKYIIYICNAMSQGGETDNYSMEDHVRAIHKHLGFDCITHVIANAYDDLPEDILLKYKGEYANVVSIKEKEHSYKVVKGDFLDMSQGNVRHKSDAIAKAIETICKEG